MFWRFWVELMPYVSILINFHMNNCADTVALTVPIPRHQKKLLLEAGKKYCSGIPHSSLHIFFKYSNRIPLKPRFGHHRNVNKYFVSFAYIFLLSFFFLLLRFNRPLLPHWLLPINYSEHYSINSSFLLFLYLIIFCSQVSSLVMSYIHDLKEILYVKWL
jgi:hypothetical protein